jgi:hypothetical protein
MLPPVPAAKASSIHIGLLVGNKLRSYIPIEAATSGTLSTMAEAIPIAAMMIALSLVKPSSQVAAVFKTSALSSAATARRIPRKKSILGVSILESAWDGVKTDFSWASFPR